MMVGDTIDGFLDAGSSDAFAPGESFHGYVVERPLGRGAAGAVYLVRHEMLDTLFALKVMEAPETTAGDEPVKRFLREAKLAARIQHPNLVRVHDAGFDEGKSVYYLVMDYMAGGGLRDRIAFGGPMSVKESLRIVRDVASALSAGMRMGVVHRDIKPENIMFTADGRAKLVDLGIAKACDGESIHTRTSASFGTPAYIAPEQALDASRVDSRADVYSLGIVLFEMLAGRRPYDGETATAIITQVLSDEPIPDVKRFNPAVPNWVSALLFRMCAKDPAKRISSVGKLQGILDERLGKNPDAVTDFAAEPEKRLPAYVPDPAVDAEVERDIAAMTQRKAAARRRSLLIRAVLAVLGALALLAGIICMV